MKLIVALFLFGADIAPDPVNRRGEALSPKTDTKIQMEAETVTIDLRENAADVHAVFTLKNTADAEETLEVGFPSAAQPEGYEYSSNGIKVGKWGAPSIYAFTAKVDGESVQSQPKDARHDKGVGIVGWLCWSMTFKPNQTRKVEVSYTIASADENYTIPSPLQNRQITYILKTGAGWKDVIGSATVIINTNGMTLDKISPEPTTKTDKAWTWEMKNFEPDADVLIQYRLYADAKAAIAKLEPRLEKENKDPELLLDLADNYEADKQPARAAPLFAKLHQLGKDLKWPIFRHHTPYVPAAYRAYKNFADAGAKDDAATWVKTAVDELDAAVKQLEGRDIWARKSYRQDPDVLKKLADECRAALKDF